MIRREFGYGYIPEYHRDIMEFREHYLNPPGNTFISASLGGKVIGTLGLRAYDREFEDLNYDPETTAGLWRVFVHEDYRRRGVASLLVGIAEAHAARMGYQMMYLHTHKHLRGALEFWLSMGYRVVLDTGNELSTVHMEKTIKPREYSLMEFYEAPGVDLRKLTSHSDQNKRGGTGHQMTFF
nr:GNAT family N-acetyltransferase [Methanothermobacter sp. K4]